MDLLLGALRACASPCEYGHINMDSESPYPNSRSNKTGGSPGWRWVSSKQHSAYSSKARREDAAIRPLAYIAGREIV